MHHLRQSRRPARVRPRASTPFLFGSVSPCTPAPAVRTISQGGPLPRSPYGVPRHLCDLCEAVPVPQQAAANVQPGMREDPWRSDPQFQRPGPQYPTLRALWHPVPPCQPISEAAAGRAHAALLLGSLRSGTARSSLAGSRIVTRSAGQRLSRLSVRIIYFAGMPWGASPRTLAPLDRRGFFMSRALFVPKSRFVLMRPAVLALSMSGGPF
jgi:hypothetical protein